VSNQASLSNALNIKVNERTRSQWLLLGSIRLLSTLVWLSTLLFGLYILAFYAVPFFQQEMESWNQTLNNLYTEGENTATAGIGAHFIAGGVILILGCVQLVSGIRERMPKVHRVTGRIYVTAAIVTSIGGLFFVVAKGTIGGWVMDLGFALYGTLMFICAVMTIKLAMAKQFEQHRIWALRLFALAIGSWLYRMDYGFWYLLADNAGHNDTFTGPFDYFMDFFFFIPNLLVVELIVRAPKNAHKPVRTILASAVLIVASGFVVLGTYAFTSLYWGPAILGVFA
jgi:hypothetical protein